MNIKVKIVAYVVLIIAAAYFGHRLVSEYKESNQPVATVSEDDSAANPEPATVTATNQIVETNAAESSTNVAANTNQAAQTASNSASTNVAAQVTKSNVIGKVQTANSQAVSTSSAKPRKNMWSNMSSIVGWLGAFVGTFILLGLLIARDVSSYFGSRAVDFLFNDDGVGMKDPEYEQAEQVWANGKPLEAIQLMRNYLKKYPREIHVAKRIAEIYEKDLGNYLAAALEYEEILKPNPKYRFPPESWGWSAIHLCNIYFKLNKTDQAVALLRRIVSEYGQTAAAEKARKRLTQLAADGHIEPIEEPVADKPANSSIKTEPEPPSNLPPGFRPKK